LTVSTSRERRLGSLFMLAVSATEMPARCTIVHRRLSSGTFVIGQ
jgi:hypothetical protein